MNPAPAEIPPTPQTPPNSPPISPPPTGGPPNLPLFLIIGAIILIALIATSTFFLGKSQNNQSNSPSPSSTSSSFSTFSPTPTPDPTADWQSLSLDQLELKIPSTWWSNKYTQSPTDKWIMINPTSLSGNPEPLPAFEIHEYNTNLEQKKSQLIKAYPIDIISETSITIANLQGKKLSGKIPRGPLANKSIEIIFLPLNDTLYSFVNFNLAAESEVFFNQILQTFKFTDAENVSTSPIPTLSAHKLTYSLPTGWTTLQDKTGTLEIAYDSKKATLFGNDSLGNLSINLGQKSGYGQYFSAFIKPYDGGSRHKFILGNEVLKDQDKMPDYHEKTYSYNGWNCLVLYGISLSQWPSTEGMCAISSTQAIGFNTWQDDTGTEQIIKTIRLLK